MVGELVTLLIVCSSQLAGAIPHSLSQLGAGRLAETVAKTISEEFRENVDLSVVQVVSTNRDVFTPPHSPRPPLHT